MKINLFRVLLVMNLLKWLNLIRIVFTKTLTKILTFNNMNLILKAKSSILNFYYLILKIILTLF